MLTAVPHRDRDAGVLLDTNVISELRKRRPHPAVVDWLRAVPSHNLYLSALTIGELQAGVEVTRAQDPEKAEEIESSRQHLECLADRRPRHACLGTPAHGGTAG
jgi:predicted nucleic acid-binding protein